MSDPIVCSRCGAPAPDQERFIFHDCRSCGASRPSWMLRTTWQRLRSPHLGVCERCGRLSRSVERTDGIDLCDRCTHVASDRGWITLY